MAPVQSNGLQDSGVPSGKMPSIDIAVETASLQRWPNGQLPSSAARIGDCLLSGKWRARKLSAGRVAELGVSASALSTL